MWVFKCAPFLSPRVGSQAGQGALGPSDSSVPTPKLFILPLTPTFIFPASVPRARHPCVPSLIHSIHQAPDSVSSTVRSRFMVSASWRLLSCVWKSDTGHSQPECPLPPCDKAAWPSGAVPESCLSRFHPPQNPIGVSLPHFTEVETEALRGSTLTCWCRGRRKKGPDHVHIPVLERTANRSPGLLIS